MKARKRGDLSKKMAEMFANIQIMCTFTPKNNTFTIMKKRILITMIALLAMTMGAWAVDYNVLIGGTEIKSDNIDKLNDGVTFSAIKSGTVSFDPTTNTLTLTNAVLNSSDYAIHFNVSGRLIFEGTNTLTSTGKSAIYLNHDQLVIQGSGTLTANGSLNYDCGILISKHSSSNNAPTLIINGEGGGTVIATGAYGICGMGLSDCTESLVINGANVRVTGSVEGSICDLASFTLNGCEITSPAGAAFSGTAVKLNNSVVKSEIVIKSYVPIDSNHFPNYSFRSYVTTNYDRDSDGYLSDEEIARVNYMSIGSKNFYDITGIEYFTSMTSLFCQSNHLTTLDLSGCTSLKHVQCNGNQMTSLTLPQGIEDVQCYNNQLTSLTVPSSIISIQCYNNRIGYTAMQELVESLPTVTGGTLTVAYTSGEQNICTEWQVEIANGKGWNVYSSNNQTYTGSGLPINDEDIFPDEKFRTFLSRNTIDTNTDGYLTKTEIAEVTSMDLSSRSLTSLVGIEYFTELEYINCNYNNLTEVDLSHNTKLKRINCSEAHVEMLTVPRTSTLTEINCNNNQLLALDVSGCNNLKTLSCYNNHLNVLFVTNITTLTTLHCLNNQLTTLGITNCSALEEVQAGNNQLSQLNITGCSKLRFLSIYNNQIKQTKMNDIVSKLPTPPTGKTGTLTVLYTGPGGEGNQYSDQNVEDAELKNWYLYGFDGTNSQKISADYVVIEEYGNPNFPDADFRNYVKTNFDTDGNGALSMQELMAVTSIDVSGLPISDLKGIEFFTALTSLKCSGCGVESLDLSRNTLLVTLHCNNNTSLNNLDISPCPNIRDIRCYACSLTDEAIQTLFNTLPQSSVACNLYIYKRYVYEKNDLSLTAGQLSDLNARNWNIYIKNEDDSDKLLTTGVISISPKHFPDNNFRIYINRNIDTDADLLLSDTEAETVKNISLNGQGIGDLTGIERFMNLETLWCQDNNLTFLDVSKNTKLSTLNCQNNQIVMLDVSGTDLYDLNCYGNQIKGDAMQLLIDNLPTNRTARRGYLTVYNTSGDEGNSKPTSTQVSTADSRGWYVFTTDNGSSTTLVKPLTAVQINSLNFPDANFRNYVSQKLDKDGDGTLSAEELENTKYIEVSTKEIEDLKGIEFFTRLLRLECSYNNLTTLDVSKNTQLTKLTCTNNQLTTLDVSKNTALETLFCSDNSLTTLDVSHNTVLKELYCASNQLLSLDVSHNPALKNMSCDYNQLTTLDFTNNPAVTHIAISNNVIRDEGMGALVQSLPTVSNGTLVALMNSNDQNIITIEQIHMANTKGWKVEKFPYSILRMPGQDVEINATYFPDENFRNFVSNNYDTNNNGILENDEMRGVIDMDVSGQSITDLTGLGFFYNIENLDCHNNGLTKLDLSYFNYLTSVKCYQNRIQGDNMEALIQSLLVNYTDEQCTIIIRSSYSSERNETPTDEQINTANRKKWTVYTYDGNSYTTLEGTKIAINATNFPDINFRNYVSQYINTDGDNYLSYKEIKEITEINVDEMEISSLQGIEFFTNLKWLSCMFNNLTTLDVSNNTALTNLYCNNNQLTSLNLTGCTELFDFHCFDNLLTTLDLSDCTNLYNLLCNQNNLQGTLDLSNNKKLKEITVIGNSLTALNLSQCVLLEKIWCQNNQLTALDLSKNVMLKELYCHENKLTSLDLSHNKLLTKVQCYSNRIAASAMQTLVEKLPTVSNGTIISVNYADENEQNVMTEAQAAIATGKGWRVKAYDQEDFQELVVINATHFPDENFRNFVSENYDIDHDGKLSRAEAEAVEVMWVNNMNINNLTGIEYFTELLELYCHNESGETDTKNHLTSLDLSANTKLTRVACGQNEITILNIANCTELGNLHCSNNQLTALDVTHNTKLWRLCCWNNKLTTLNVSNNPLLQEFICWENQLTSLDVSNHTALDDLSICPNPLTSLNVSGCTALTYLGISSTNLTQLDLSNNPTLTSLYLSDNDKLPSVDLSRCTALERFEWANNDVTAFPDLSHNTALKKIYCWENNGLTSISVPNLPSLTYVAVVDNSNLTSIDVSNCTALDTLYCYGNKLTTLNVSNNHALTSLACSDNQLTTLDVSHNTLLTGLYCSDNQLQSFDVSHNTALLHLNCGTNQLSSLDLSHNTALNSLSCGHNQLSTLDLSSNTALTYLDIYVNPMTSIDLSHNTALEYFYCGDQLTTLDLSHNPALKYFDCSISNISSLVISPDAADLDVMYCFNSELRGGNAIDNLIASLPTRTSSWGFIYFRTLDNDEHNFCTYDQVYAAWRKGWYFLEHNIDNWHVYYGITATPGDINSDGVVTVADVTALVNIILGKTTDYDTSVADVNGDTHITVADVKVLLDMVLGKSGAKKAKAGLTAAAKTHPRPLSFKEGSVTRGDDLEGEYSQQSVPVNVPRMKSDKLEKRMMKEALVDLQRPIVPTRIAK